MSRGLGGMEAGLCALPLHPLTPITEPSALRLVLEGDTALLASASAEWLPIPRGVVLATLELLVADVRTEPVVAMLVAVVSPALFADVVVLGMLGPPPALSRTPLVLLGLRNEGARTYRTWAFGVVAGPYAIRAARRALVGELPAGVALPSRSEITASTANGGSFVSPGAAFVAARGDRPRVVQRRLLR